MEGIETQDSKRPWSGFGAWVGVAAGRSLPWLDGMVGGRAEPRGSGERPAGSLALTPVGAVSDGDARRLVMATSESSAEPSGAAALVHDARNMVTAIELYCDLLDQPGVLTEGCRHYAAELRTVSAASRRLLERIGAAEGAMRERGSVHGPRLMYSAPQTSVFAAIQETVSATSEHSVVRRSASAERTLARPGRMQAFGGGEPVTSLSQELKANQALLAAVAGTEVTTAINITGGDAPVEMARDDLSRVLVNLTRNAAEAMPGGGHLEITLEVIDDRLSLSFRDSGSGIAPEAMERIFIPGYTTHLPRSGSEVDGESAGVSQGAGREGGRWPVQHRGLGLTIVRSLVSAARGVVWAANREDGCGAVFTVEFPLRKRGGRDETVAVTG